MSEKQQSRGPASGAAVAAACAAVALVVVLTYLRGIGGPFIYDDVDSIGNNPSIRSFASALRPPGGLTVSGRPILNLSFALNYAVSGENTWSYHALNLALHAAAALLLLGLVRRTLAMMPGRGTAADRLAVAAAAACLWALHPLQTESVEYVVQRAECLMGVFYLLTLYAFARSAEPGARPGGWAALSAGACLLGMGTKEVMATAPVVVLLYDRTFVSGTFGRALRSRPAYYASMAASWALLAFLVAGTGERGGTAGFGSGVPWWAYFSTQCTAVVHYLRLVAWPNPLVGDYGRILEGNHLRIALCAALLAALAGASALLAFRRSAAGFLGAAFFIVLSPSSSFVPVSTEIMAEHRMYLALAAPVVLVVAGIWTIGGRRAVTAAFAVLAAAFAWATWARLPVYGGSYAFWSDVAAKVPGNAGAWNNLGILLAERGDRLGAMADYRRALAIAPDYAYAHYNLGNSLMAGSEPAAAAAQFQQALRYRPNDASIHFNLGNALARLGDRAASIQQYRGALRSDPSRYDAWFNLADALGATGDLPGSADAYAHAVALKPGEVDARINYGNVLAQLGRLPDAARELGQALRAQPDAADIHNDLGGVLAEEGLLAEARGQFEEALRLRPGYADAADNLARVRSIEARGTGP